MFQSYHLWKTRLIASIKVSVVKSVTNSRCVHPVVTQVNTSMYAINSSEYFE